MSPQRWGLPTAASALCRSGLSGPAWPRIPWRSGREPAGGEALVRVPVVFGDLGPEPVGRLERVRRVHVGELDLGHAQALQLALEEVQLDLKLAERHHPSALADPRALGQRPQLRVLLLVQLELDLGPHLSGPVLDGQHLPAGPAAHPHLGAVLGDRQVALVDSSWRLGLVGYPVDQELALDLHQPAHRPPAFAHATMWSTEQNGSPTRCSPRWRTKRTCTSPSSASQWAQRSGGVSSTAGPARP